MEEFLKDIHAKDYTGNDDDMPDHFDDWISELDVDQWIRFSEKFAHEQYLKGFEKAEEIGLRVIKNMSHEETH